VDGEFLDDDAVRPKLALTPEVLCALEHEADALLGDGRLEDAEMLFKKVFHRYDTGQRSSYDLIIDYYERRFHPARRDHWRAERISFLNADVPGHPFFDPEARVTRG
jgi:hypothetical protein